MVFGSANAFSWIFDAVSSKKTLPDLNAFLVNLHWTLDSRVFPACWILIGQFKFQARQPYARKAFVKGFY